MKFEPLGNGFGLWVSGNHIFGTDAILLANFAKAKKNDKIQSKQSNGCCKQRFNY